MYKRIITIFILLMLVCVLSGCGENYPFVVVNNSKAESKRLISLGKPYTYIDFDIENTDVGKDLILHFEEKSNNDK